MRRDFSFARLYPLAVAATFVLAIATRLYLLDTLPPGLKYDSATNGLHVLDILYEGTHPFYVNHLGAPEPLILYLQSAAAWLLGINVLALRIVSAIASILTVFALYFCVLEFVRDRRIALVAAFALTISLQQIHDARAGLRFMLVPLFEAALFYFFWRGWRDRSRVQLIIAGFVLGLSIYTYSPALMFSVILAVLWVHQFLFARSDWRARWLDPLWTMSIAFVFALPRIIFIASYPTAAFARAGQVNVFWNPETQQAGLVYVVAARLVAYAKLFGIEWQDALLQQPLLEPFLFLLFLCGVVVCLVRWKRTEWFWPFVVIPMMLLPDLVAGNEPVPSRLRTNGILPPTYFLVGVGAIAVLDRLASRPRIHRIAELGLIGMLILSAVRTLDTYFVQRVAATPLSTEWNEFNLSPIEVAEARWIVQQSAPVYLPLNEFARSPVRYLVGARAPHLRSALRPDGSLDPQAKVDHALLLLPINPDRMRSEGVIYVNDPASFVLVNGDTVYLLPPAHVSVPQRSPDVVVRDMNHNPAANAYAVDTAESIQFDQLPAQPVTQFSQGIKLLGYQVDLGRVQPGETIPVSLFWSISQRTGADYAIFVHLINMDEAVAANADILPALGAYETFLWKPGEIIPTHHQIKVPQRTPPGKYRVEVGLYNNLNQDRLDVIDAHGSAVANRVVVGTVKVAPRQAPPANPEHPQPIDFDHRAQLLGYDLKSGESPSQFQLSLYWRARAEMDRDYTVFVHILNSDGKIVAQADHQPQQGNYPTSIWDVGETVRDDVPLAIPDEVPAGAYKIEIGWYDLATGARLPAFDAHDQPLGDHILLDLLLEVRR
ncbi:MAG: glycosyltransferase family 39 protein [Chloroflexi bacterium]|nr:glycosyltransferase family 39 protein [Chloroflexota bacterium]